MRSQMVAFVDDEWFRAATNLIGSYGSSARPLTGMPTVHVQGQTHNYVFLTSI